MPLQLFSGDKHIENIDVTTTNTRAKIDPSLMIHRGGTTFLIGIRFADKGDTLEDKVKRMVKKDVQSGNL